MTSFLREHGLEVDFFIPNRFKDGYGLSRAGIDFAVSRGARLVVALDCGITAHEEAAYARQQGLDLIICDHHTATATIPDAVAVLDPKRPDCPYPFKELCGCGVGFKLVQAVLARLGEDPARALAYLDLVAVATASDIVPVVGENRVLMAEGLHRLRQDARPGFQALASRARIDLAACSTSQIVFAIGPRINAAGRLGEAGRAVDLMLEQDPGRARQLAGILEEANKQRKLLDRETLNTAHHMAERQLTARMRHAVVLHQADWHLGVIGIVASRIVERFHRPTILLTNVNGLAKGSARSITGINVYDALVACSDLHTEFGGHDYAAGMSLPVDNSPVFRERFDAAIGERVTPEMLLPVLEADAELDLEDIDRRFWAVLKQFAPFGPENKAPIFHARQLSVAHQPRTMGQDGKHLKFQVRRAGSLDATTREVVGFNMHHYLPVLQTSQRQGQPLELMFSIQENTWRGTTTMQLRAYDLRLEE
jgi:single-stranded-DNA-specific exonuclease